MKITLAQLQSEVDALNSNNKLLMSRIDAMDSKFQSNKLLNELYFFFADARSFMFKGWNEDDQKAIFTAMYAAENEGLVIDPLKAFDHVSPEASNTLKDDLDKALAFIQSKFPKADKLIKQRFNKPGDAASSSSSDLSVKPEHIILLSLIADVRNSIAHKTFNHSLCVRSRKKLNDLKVLSQSNPHMHVDDSFNKLTELFDVIQYFLSFH